MVRGERDRDEGLTRGAVRAGDETAYEEPHPGVHSAVLGGAHVAGDVLPPAEGEE